MLQNEEACVLEVRKYGSSQHVEEPWEGFYNSPPTPPPPSWEEGRDRPKYLSLYISLE